MTKPSSTRRCRILIYPVQPRPGAGQFVCPILIAMNDDGEPIFRMERIEVFEYEMTIREPAPTAH